MVYRALKKNFKEDEVEKKLSSKIIARKENIVIDSNYDAEKDV
jgi:hypothetical protein